MHSFQFISVTQTWEINEKLFAGERNLEELEDIVKAERVPDDAGSMKDIADATTTQPLKQPTPEAAASSTKDGETPNDKTQKDGAVASKQSKPEKASTPSEGDGRVAPPITTTSSQRAMSIANRLEALDAKLYGAYWCRYTFAQKERLGREAFSKIQYIECSKDGKNSALETCRKNRVQGYPTWEIYGEMYPGEQELNELEAILDKIEIQQK